MNKLDLNPNINNQIKYRWSKNSVKGQRLAGWIKKQDPINKASKKATLKTNRLKVER